jgi:histone H3/H4
MADKGDGKTPEFEPPQVQQHFTCFFQLRANFECSAIAPTAADSAVLITPCCLHQACVQRVIKSVLPESAQIGKDAKAAFARSAGIFILYLTACANDFCKDAKRQTISAQDVMMVRSACIFIALIM